MAKNDIARRFSEKLTQIMEDQGYVSNRANGSIDIKSLASIAGCSYQMARKYALGEVLPEITVIEIIAKHLKCHPSNLLFDYNESSQYLMPFSNSSNIIAIEKNTLKYILNKSLVLLTLSSDSKDIVNFIVETVYDAAHLDVDQQTLHKIIDMMISSATLLNKTDQDDKICSN